MAGHRHTAAQPAAACIGGDVQLVPDRFHTTAYVLADFSIAVKFGYIQAVSGPHPSLDTLIAATAITKRLTLVTHNSRDMARAGAAVLDPWAEKS